MTYQILLIDHDPDGAQVIQRVLTEGGYEVVLAGDAAEAMRTFEEVRPDLALIEALLPDKPGGELCQEIRTTPAGKGTPLVLLLENEEDKQARARALDLHDCDLLIERSIDPDELLRLCEQLLETRRAQAEAAGEAVSEPEKAAPKEEPATSAVLEEKDESEEVLDSGGLADALSQLDTIIDRQEPPEEVEPAEAVAETKEAAQEEKTRRAEKAGDFSYIVEETSGATNAVGGSESPASAEKPSVPVPSAAEAYGNNEIESGQDISDHLDSLFAAEGPGEPTKAEKQVLSWTFDNGALPADQASPESGAVPPPPEAAPSAALPPETAPPQPEPTVEAAVPAPEFPDLEAIGDDLIPWKKPGDEPEDEAPPEPSAEAAGRKEIEQPTGAAAKPSADAAVAAPASQTAGFTRPRPQAAAAAPAASGTKKWWLVAACVAVIAVGGTFMIFFRGGSKGGPSTAGMGLGGTPPANETPLVAAVTTTADPVETAQAPETLVPVGSTDLETTTPSTDPAEPVKPATTRPAPVPAAPKPKPVAKQPEPKPAAPKPKPVAKQPEPKPAAPKPQPVAKQPEPKPAAPKPQPVAKQPEPKPAAPAAALDPAPVEVAVLVPPPSREPAVSSPEPEPSPAPAAKVIEPTPAPAEPVLTPVELVSRTEPAFPPKSLKRARGGEIVLKLLVNEKGRVSRVLVDRGTPHKDLEAAAVGAVLGWKFRPATEDGVAVKAWTTAEFVF